MCSRCLRFVSGLSRQLLSVYFQVSAKNVCEPMNADFPRLYIVLGLPLSVLLMNACTSAGRNGHHGISLVILSLIILHFSMAGWVLCTYRRVLLHPDQVLNVVLMFGIVLLGPIYWKIQFRTKEGCAGNSTLVPQRQSSERKKASLGVWALWGLILVGLAMLLLVSGIAT